MLYFSSTVFAEEAVIPVGEEVRLVFTIGEARNVAGLSMTAFYNNEFLRAESVVCNVNGSDYYLGNPGIVRWSFVVYNGTDFNNESIAEVTFKTKKPCTVEEMNLSYKCEELFDTDINSISEEPDKLFSVTAMNKKNSFSVYEVGHIIEQSDVKNISDSTSSMYPKPSESEVSDTEKPDTESNDTNSTDTNQNNEVLVSKPKMLFESSQLVEASAPKNNENTIDTCGKQNTIIYTIVLFSCIFIITTVNQQFSKLRFVLSKNMKFRK